MAAKQDSGVEPIKDIIKKVISELDGSAGKKEEKKLTQEDITAMWAGAAGRVAARHSRPASLRKGRLVVNVSDSSLLYDLTLRKTQILESLAKELKGKIQDVQFRIGDVNGEDKSEKPREKTKGRKA
ncbi:MAG: DciA family protein [Candidatus Omnitrophica bacterium]|nr:DciA family protein [Candidatus Omnitrophota bacterium]